jgi:hypothetical protein
MAWPCIRNGLGGSWMQSYTHPSLPSWSGGIPRSIFKIMVAPRNWSRRSSISGMGYRLFTVCVLRAL